MGKKVFFFFFLAVPLSMWDLGSLTQDRTPDPCSAQTLLTGPPGSPERWFLEIGVALKEGRETILAANTVRGPHSLLRLCNDLYILMTSEKINTTK